MVYPPTPTTFPLCEVTVCGTEVLVDVARVLDHLRGLPSQERAWVVDDVLFGITGAEFYPPGKIEELKAQAV